MVELLHNLCPQMFYTLKNLIAASCSSSVGFCHWSTSYSAGNYVWAGFQHIAGLSFVYGVFCKTYNPFTRKNLCSAKTTDANVCREVSTKMVVVILLLLLPLIIIKIIPLSWNTKNPENMLLWNNMSCWSHMKYFCVPIGDRQFKTWTLKSYLIGPGLLPKLWH